MNSLAMRIRASAFRYIEGRDKPYRTPDVFVFAKNGKQYRISNNRFHAVVGSEGNWSTEPTSLAPGDIAEIVANWRGNQNKSQIWYSVEELFGEAMQTPIIK